MGGKIQIMQTTLGEPESKIHTNIARFGEALTGTLRWSVILSSCRDITFFFDRLIWIFGGSVVQFRNKFQSQATKGVLHPFHLALSKVFRALINSENMNEQLCVRKHSLKHSLELCETKQTIIIVLFYLFNFHELFTNFWKRKCKDVKHVAKYKIYQFIVSL